MSVTLHLDSLQTHLAQSMAGQHALLARSMGRLATGSRHEQASSDGGGLSLSLKISAAVTRLSALRQNVANGVSFLQAQDQALEQSYRLADRISQLVTLYNDPLKTDSDKATYDLEFRELSQQISELAQGQFNGRGLFATEDDQAFQVAHTLDGGQHTDVSLSNLLQGDFKQIVNAGLGVANNSGGLGFLNILAATSGISLKPGGNIAMDDVFSVQVSNSNLGDSSSVLNASYTAVEDDERADNPANSIRDNLINVINSDSTAQGLVVASDDPSDDTQLILAPASPGVELDVSISNSSTQGGIAVSTTQANVVELTVDAGYVEAGYVYSLQVDGNTVQTAGLSAGASDEDLRDAFVTAINAAGLELTAANGAGTDSLVITADSTTPGSTPINPDNILLTNGNPGTQQTTVANVVGQARTDRFTLSGGQAESTQQDQVTITPGNLDAGSTYSVDVAGITYSITEGVDFDAATATAADLATALAGAINGPGGATTIPGAGVTADASAGDGTFTLTSDTSGAAGAYTLSTSTTDTGAAGVAGASLATATDADTVTATLEGNAATVNFTTDAATTIAALKSQLESIAAVAPDFTLTDNGDGTLDVTSNTQGTDFTQTIAGTGTASTNVGNATVTPAVAAVAQEDEITIYERKISAGDTVSVDIDGTTITTAALSGGESVSNVRDALLTAIQADNSLAVSGTSTGGDQITLVANSPGVAFASSGLATTAASAGDVLLDSGSSLAQVESLTITPDVTGEFASGDTLEIQVNSETVSVTTTENQTTDEIRDALVTAINDLATLEVTASSGGTGELELTSDVQGQGFTVNSSTDGGDTFTTSSDSSNFFSYSLTAALEHISTLRAQNAAQINRLHFAGSQLDQQVQDFGQARGAIMDVDIAMESTRLARQQLRFEMTGIFLVQGNMRPNIALSLLSN